MYIYKDINDDFSMQVRRLVDDWWDRNSNKCLNYLQQKTKKILELKIAEVYSINSFRKQVLPLEVMYNSIKIENLGAGRFSIFVDDSYIVWKTVKGNNIYQIVNGENKQEEDQQVRSLQEYWQTPIQRKREDDYYFNETLKEIDIFIKEEFIPWVKRNFNKEGAK